MGLFCLVTSAYIHDFTLQNVSLTATEDGTRIGALAGNLQHWNVVENIKIDGVKITVNGKNGLVGAAVGYMWRSQVNHVDVQNATINVTGDGNTVSGHTAYARGHVWDTDVIGKNTHWLADSTFGTSIVQNLFVNCNVKDASITLSGSGEGGGFIGFTTYNYHSNYFNDCTVSGLKLTAKDGTFNLGGFIAANNGSTSAPVNSKYTQIPFDGCSASGTITGVNGSFGDFVGECNGRSHGYENASANVQITQTGSGNAGGFAGSVYDYANHKFSFINCTATGTVTNASTSGSLIGYIGLGGDGYAANVEIKNCTATGSGSIIGKYNDNSKKYSYSAMLTLNVPYTGASQSSQIGSTDVCKQNGEVVDPIDVGTYDVYLKDESASYARLTITPAVLTITANNQSMQLGDEIPSFTCTVAGLRGSDTLMKSPIVHCAADGTATGQFPITLSDADAGSNYTIQYVSGMLTVSEKQPEPTVSPTVPVTGNDSKPPKTGDDTPLLSLTLLAGLSCLGLVILLRRKAAQ